MKTDKVYYDEAKAILEDPQKIASAGDVKELIEIIQWADRKYYVEDHPVLSDQEYDKLYAILKAVENEHPQWQFDYSPTQNVADGLNSDFEKVDHIRPMLSLDNSYNAEDLREWNGRIERLLDTQSVQYTVEPKFDGASISAWVSEHQIQRVLTRGNGTTGDDITRNARQIKSLPQYIRHEEDLAQAEIRGEVVMKWTHFDNYNEWLVNEGKSPMVNPRNAASGSLRMKDPKELKRRKLTAFMYHVSYYEAIEKRPFDTHLGALEWLQAMGFQTALKYTQICTGIEEVVQYCRDFELRRDDLGFEIDGMVVKVNALSLQDKLGSTAHHPRWAMAYKFAAKQATSKLERVEYQVGRTGSVTPVAKIEPVFVGGVTISSVSLFNEDAIREKDLMLGDVVVVERSGDVIPYIRKSLAELRTGDEKPILFPGQCPVCQTPLLKEENDAAWRCPNYDCEAQIEERLIHFVSKNAMDIKHIGESHIRKLYEMKMIRKPEDIYTMDVGLLEGQEGYGEKTIENMRAAIEESKDRAAHRVLFALGVRHVGQVTAQNICLQLKDSLWELEAWTREELEAIDDVGPIVARSVWEYFRSESARETLHSLESSGVNLAIAQKEQNTEGPLSGKTILFTGAMNMKRKEAEELAESRGASILSGVSAKLDYLVVGEKAGSKLQKAEKLGTVKILTEEQFLDLINTDGS